MIDWFQDSSVKTKISVGSSDRHCMTYDNLVMSLTAIFRCLWSQGYEYQSKNYGLKQGVRERQKSDISLLIFSKSYCFDVHLPKMNTDTTFLVSVKEWVESILPSVKWSHGSDKLFFISIWTIVDFDESCCNLFVKMSSKGSKVFGHMNELNLNLITTWLQQRFMSHQNVDMLSWMINLFVTPMAADLQVWVICYSLTCLHIPTTCWTFRMPPSFLFFLFSLPHDLHW